ncbi:MAG: sel1 repeat family protein [Gammaproteobacteria bacterium]|nr:sel1 repeat family protein [Gammaproteobacteria bacterium]MDH5800607.1 sel1 repeat family protein [Gammaproteobacteria bacterium]
MKRIIIAIAVIFTSQAAWSAPYKSMFGFEYDLPSGWSVLKSDAAKNELLRDLGSNDLYQGKGFGDLLEKIQAGEVEYLLSDKINRSNFKNNMRIQLVKSSNQTNLTDESYSCAEKSKELKDLYFRQIRMKGCHVKKSNGVAYLEYSFSRPHLKIEAVQSEIPIGPGMKLVLMGTSDTKVVKSLVRHHSYMLDVVIEHYKDAKNVPVNANKAITESKPVETVSTPVISEAKLDDSFSSSGFDSTEPKEDLSATKNSTGFDNTKALFRARSMFNKSDEKDSYRENDKDDYRETIKEEEKVQKSFDDQNRLQAIDLSQSAEEMEKMAEAYFTGKGVTKDIDRSISLFDKAANLGLASAQNRYASILYQGLGIKKNPNEAKKWFLEAAKQGHKQAGNNIVAIYNAEARSGNESSRHALALMYINGDGVEKDPYRGVSLLEKAAKHGHDPSRAELEKIYSEGLHGITKNPDMALKWSASK